MERRRAQGRAYYQRHKERLYVKYRARIAPKQAWLSKLKESQPCKDCGGFFPSCCMDFDHLPGQEKKLPLAHLLHYKDPAVVENEMAKCELVCANCHRIRTRDRRKLK